MNAAGNYMAITHGFLRGLRELKSTGTLCDVVLKGSENSAANIPCHRNVLSAHSSYFRTLFTSGWKESSQSEIQLKNTPSQMLHKLIDFAYTMEIDVHEENVQSVLTAALFLDIAPVADICWDFLQTHLDSSSCLMVYSASETHKNPCLAEKAKNLVLRHFAQVSRGEDFLLIDADKLMDLFVSDALHVEKEDDVFRAVKRWFDHDTAGRKAQLSDVLQFVRVTFLDPGCLEDYFLALYNGFQSVPCTGASSSGVINELPGRRAEAATSRGRPRESHGFPTVISCFGGNSADHYTLNETNVFSPSIPMVYHFKDLPQPVANCGVVVLDDSSIFVCGGLIEFDDGMSSTPKANQYNPVRNQ
ncbi:kelch-like protein 26 [Paramacrobiotus metropolitanus]|uniref:kelch-like protein 26 n=1 Tax=Paramacrobiotus metropolitanus TaxID=2943436 RepID=UPI0024460733|nr:kelch-like protein 26 [Paramacrobiotus metropolitanus]